jgi:hypothetical protein
MTKRYGNILNHKYHVQKIAAASRGIEWNFTYDSWIEWWGNDIGKRGRGKGKLQMGRIGDIGPYHPDNCIKILHELNSAAPGCKPKSAEHRAKIKASNIRTAHLGLRKPASNAT